VRTHSFSTSPISRHRPRRGSALLAVLLIAAGLAALALSASFLSGNASILSRHFDSERDYRYAAEAALAIAKSRVNHDKTVLPDTGFVQLMADQPLTDAQGVEIPGVTVNVWVGPSGATSGQFGTFASVVSEARDARGSRFVRRAELTQETFAKFAYWSDRESNISGTKIFFNNGDILWGPVWSNDTISIGSGGATFNDEVGTAKRVAGMSNGTFKKGVKQNQKPIELPTMERLAFLEARAADGNLAFVPPNAGPVSGIKERLEFIAINLNPGTDNDVTDRDEGFVRVYQGFLGTTAAYVRGDRSNDNCGDWHADTPGGKKKFYPVAVHGTTWFYNAIRNGGLTVTQANTHVALTSNQILSIKDARCFPGGDPHLAPVERNTVAWPAAAKEKGGEDSTFTPVGRFGAWRQWPGPIDPRLVGRGDAGYLFPLYRGQNDGVKGVIFFNGSVGVSGVVRGRVTLYAKGSIALVDDLRYATDPKTGTCDDMLGIIVDNNILIADNAVNTPQNVGTWKNLDDSKDFHLHAVMMALNTSFGAEDYNTGPTNVNDCEGIDVGRGCLYLAGGIIQQARGAVGLASGEGFIKRYSYDRCAAQQPPPYYPTTGRFIDNRYFEVDPVGFDIAQLFASLSSM
jgi:hypothetical protein